MLLQNRMKNTRYADLGQYTCEITDFLDEQSVVKSKYLHYYYLLADDFQIQNGCLAVRVPGCTVGYVKIDDSKVITDLRVTRFVCNNQFPEDINDKLQRFIGDAIEL